MCNLAKAVGHWLAVYEQTRILREASGLPFCAFWYKSFVAASRINIELLIHECITASRYLLHDPYIFPNCNASWTVFFTSLLFLFYIHECQVFLYACLKLGKFILVQTLLIFCASHARQLCSCHYSQNRKTVFREVGWGGGGGLGVGVGRNSVGSRPLHSKKLAE